MAAKRTRSFWVGAFVVTGLLIGLAALVWLGTADWFAKRNRYVTYFAVSVQGLNVDSPVKFRGVDVGKVRGLAIAPDGVLIEVTLDLGPTFKVTSSLRSTLGLSGITGMKYIELNYAEEEDLTRHPELRFQPPHPVIPSQPGGFEEISASLRTIYEKLLAVDTEGISWRTKAFLDTGTRMMGRVDSLAASKDLTVWMTKIGRAADRADSLLALLDTRRYDTEIDTALTQLRAGSRAFRRLMVELDRQASALRLDSRSDTLFHNLDDLVVSGREAMRTSRYGVGLTLDHVNATMDELNVSLTQLNSLLMSLESYPGHVIYALPPAEEK